MDSDDEHPPSTKGPGSLAVPIAPPAPPAPKEAPPVSVVNLRAPIALEAAYAQACEQMEGVPPVAAGYRLFWVRHREVGWMDLPDAGAYAVIGHHEACDVKLREGAGVALRHLLATTVRLADGLALRILDLHTRFPFALADGVPRRSVVICGPVALRLGDYVIGGVPVEEDEVVAGKAHLKKGTLPRAVVSEGVSLPLSVRPPPSAHPAPASAAKVSPYSYDDDNPVTSVTSLPPSMSIGQRRNRGLPRAQRPPAPDALEEAMLDELGAEGPGCAWVTLRREGQSAGVELSEGELDRGVVVGRSEGCHDGLKTVLDTNISRGHLLLLHHHGVFEAFDLCSTQGSYSAGRSVRRFLLPDGGAQLQLATKDPVLLEWKRSGARSPDA